jgi:signal transduction protein with GAF and PtsI domain
MSFVPAPMTSNEDRRLESVNKLGVIGTNQTELFEIYCELSLQISGYSTAACSLIDSDTQHGLSACSISPEITEMLEGGKFKIQRSESPCAYAILTSNPLIVPDCRQHEIFKEAGSVKAGMNVAYAGFPIINKDNYVFGTLCMFDPEVRSLNTKQVELLKKLTQRLAHQLDTQSEKRAITAEQISNAITHFSDEFPNASLKDFNSFVALCSGKDLEHESIINLKHLSFCEIKENGRVELTNLGNKLQYTMGLQTKVLNKRRVEGEDADLLVNDMLSELEGM